MLWLLTISNCYVQVSLKKLQLCVTERLLISILCISCRTPSDFFFSANMLINKGLICANLIYLHE